MKVGTDGCLLGSWASAGHPKRILDIGAGSGLIGLMLAQRYSNARVDAVELESECAYQCIQNIKNSPWPNRISCYNVAIQDFKPNTEYDLIVSNPPFFKNAYAAPKQDRHMARHDDSLSVNELFSNAKRLVAKTGFFCAVIPTERFTDFTNAAHDHDFFLVEKVIVKPTPAKPGKRLLLKYSLSSHLLNESSMIIEKARGEYSEDFTKLLQDFYLYL